MSSYSPHRTAFGLVLLGGLAMAGCSTGGDVPAPAASGEPAGQSAQSAATNPTTTQPLSIRDRDVTDVDTLASQLASGATGDQEWIDVFAELRVMSWLAARYPGAYDLSDIYAEEWSIDHARVLEESVDLEVYIDEPLPMLLSVASTRELGELVELEVVLDAGAATIRRDADDVALGSLPGGRQRGLFTLGLHPSTARWRIHSVIELSVVEAAEAGETP